MQGCYHTLPEASTTLEHSASQDTLQAAAFASAAANAVAPGFGIALGDRLLTLRFMVLTTKSIEGRLILTAVFCQQQPHSVLGNSTYPI